MLGPPGDGLLWSGRCSLQHYAGPCTHRGNGVPTSTTRKRAPLPGRRRPPVNLPGAHPLGRAPASFPCRGELRAYLECGILSYGFVRARCEQCGESRAVAFSCKRRGFCPGCMGRRIADTAARLTDDVFPRVPVRQWVLSFPYEIRYRLAYDGQVIAAVLAVFLRTVGSWYRRQAHAMGHPESRCGAVTFVQRFGSALNSTRTSTSSCLTACTYRGRMIPSLCQHQHYPRTM